VGSMAVDGRVKLRRSKFGISFWYIMVAWRLFGVTCPLSLELSSFMSWESLVTDRYSLWNDGFEHHSRKICNKLEIRHPRIVVLDGGFRRLPNFWEKLPQAPNVGHSVDPTLKSLWSIW
jgi:hypothetical protein